MKKKDPSKFGFNQWGNIKYRESIYSGCANNCLYCGVRKTQCCWLNHRDFNHWELMTFLKSKFIERTTDVGKRLGRSIFPTAHDLFPFNKVHSFKFIRKIANPETNIFNEMLIVSKARMGVFKDIPTKFKDLKEHLLFRLTITTKNDSLIKYWEGNSPFYKERLECLKLLYTKGFNTSVSIEPFLDDNESLLSLIDELKEYITDTIWVGKMNRIFSTTSLEKYQKTDSRSIKEHKRIRGLLKDKNLIELINALKNEKLIRYKDEIIKKKKITPLIPNYQTPILKAN